MFDLNIPKICAAVVLYHPDKSVFSNISNLSKILRKIVIVDNTERNSIDADFVEKLNSIHGVTYIANNDNFGIAFALNQAINEILPLNYHFILTLDQDSYPHDTYIEDIFKIIENEKVNLETVGIIAPFHQAHPDISCKSATAIEDREVVMTSGNLLNLSAYKKVGGFWNELFIDRVDHEFCLRLKMNGYRVIQLNKIVLRHGLGNMTIHTIMNKKYVTTNHSGLRRYYQVRNTLHVIKKYKQIFPEYAKWEIHNIFSNIKTILFFENKKIFKFLMMFKGYKDFKNNIFGKFSN